MVSSGGIKRIGLRPIVQTLAAIGACLGLVIGCTRALRSPDLGRIYNRAAQAPDYLRNPVIVIPGILGSRLVDEASGRVVWGAFDGKAANPNNPADARLIALPMADRVPLSQLRDTVRSDGALDRLHIRVFGLPIEVRAYAQILAGLGVGPGSGGYRDQQLSEAGVVDYGDQHFTCFQFDYDWRRDISETAQLLHEFILDRRKYVRQELHRRYGIVDADVKFDIVAHSMGGLVTRYYLRYGGQPLPEDGSPPELTWQGSQYVERAILVAPPNAGSIETLRELVQGIRIGPLLPKYPAAVLGTMPATYQLLPRSRHGGVVDGENHDDKLDIYDPELWKRLGWGLASDQQEKVLKVLLPHVTDPSTRRRIAWDHQRKCLNRARQFHRALDIDASPPAGLSLYLFAGDAIETDAVAAVSQKTGKLRIVKQSPGDGLTTRASALMDERIGQQWTIRLVSPIRWTGTTFLLTDHLGLTKDPIFMDNVLALLLESPSRDGREPLVKK